MLPAYLLLGTVSSLWLSRRPSRMAVVMTTLQCLIVLALTAKLIDRVQRHQVAQLMKLLHPSHGAHGGQLPHVVRPLI